MRETFAKTRVTVRLDTAVLDWFLNQAHQSGDASYQATREPLENTLQRVIREELRNAG